MVDEILDHAGRLDGVQALLVEHDGHLGRQGTSPTSAHLACSLRQSGGASPATAARARPRPCGTRTPPDESQQPRVAWGSSRTPGVASHLRCGGAILHHRVRHVGWAGAAPETSLLTLRSREWDPQMRATQPSGRPWRLFHKDPGRGGRKQKAMAQELGGLGSEPV